MNGHVTNSWFEDEHGFVAITCNCGWSEENFPDDETAIDAFGYHCYVQGFADGMVEASQ